MRGIIEKISRITLCAVLAALLIAPGLVPGLPSFTAGGMNITAVYADDISSVTGDAGPITALQGAEETLYFTFKNTGNEITLNYPSCSSNVISFKSGMDKLSVPSGTPADPSIAYWNFTVNISSSASPTTIRIPFIFNVVGGGTVTVDVDFNINKKDFVAQSPNSIDLSYTLSSPGGLVAGETNTLTVTLFNRGAAYLSDIYASLTLPEGMNIDNSLVEQFVGAMMPGNKSTIKFPIAVDVKKPNGTYIVSVKIAGSGLEVTRQLSLRVTGGEEKEDAAAVGDMAISGIDIPGQAKAEETFVLKFNVTNSSDKTIKNVEVAVEPADGVVNTTKSMFVEQEMSPKASKSYSVSFTSKSDVKEQSYPIKITIKSADASSTSAQTVSQYANIFIKAKDEEDKEGAKTPQLMVDNYTYGGSHVQAGDTFKLTIGLYNTSDKELRNIKATLEADAGAFVPSGGSNSYFVASIPPKGHATQSINMSVNPQAEQKVTAIKVSMTYEDDKQNEFNSTDTISIPVMQETRLEVDAIIAPPELYPGEQASLSVQFYNTGKTTLSNLRVNASGDFDVADSASYYAGNMDSGKSDSYDLSFTPRQTGPLDGKIIFTYEDPSGNAHTLEKDFQFTVMEAPDWGNMDPGMDTPQPEQSNRHWFILGGLIVVAIIAILIVRRILKKRKMKKELEIDEE